MTTALAIATPTTLVASSLNREQIELLKRTVAKGTTDDEFAFFIQTANRLGLDPFSKQIHAVKRWSRDEQREVMAIQIGIDGFRAIADRTGELDGIEGPFYCGPDLQWREAWLENVPPAASKVIVYRKGVGRPFTGVARYKSYVQTNREGKPNAMWQRGDDFMLGKCAEAVALRRGFPLQLAGVHAPEELAYDTDDAPPAQNFAALPPTAKPAPQGPPPGVALPPPTERQAMPTVAAPSSAPATHAAVASAKSAVHEPPGVSSDELAAIEAELRATTTLEQLKIVAVRLSKNAAITPQQRAQLNGVWGEQTALIKAAMREEAEAARAQGQQEMT
jgi:phage recombination protein Bet